MRLCAVLLLSLLPHTSAAGESCMGRCENGFDSEKKCQCDSMCKYYSSCCSDFEATCGMMTRGDTFVFAEDDDELFEGTTPSSATISSRQLERTVAPISDFARRPQQQQHQDATLEMAKPPGEMETLFQKVPVTQSTPNTQSVPPTEEASPRQATAAETTAVPTTAAPHPDAVVCSGRPFDSFMQLKNGSIYAFRGEYFFELDQKSVLPGYPKLIKDVWGISGPLDATFTRINCQGKTYMFKGNRYWRFDNDVLDDGYPRDISVGFDKIPDSVDAAFALPASSHRGKEKVYFFKGDRYYTYEFLHQPSHEECVSMSERSPATLFRRYTDVYYNNYQRFLAELFSDLPQHHDRHQFIERDWVGLKSPVGAAMAGRMYVPPRRPWRWNPYDQQWGQQQGQRWNQQYQQYQQYGQQWGRRRQSRSPYWGSAAEQGMRMGQGLAERGMEMGLRLAERRMEMEERLGRDWDRMLDQDWDQDGRRDGYRNNRGNYNSRRDRWSWESMQWELPIQTVYFFKGDQYYRVDLRTKSVDPAMPPYPRSIAKYWLGCSASTGAEK